MSKQKIQYLQQQSDNLLKQYRSKKNHSKKCQILIEYNKTVEQILELKQ